MSNSKFTQTIPYPWTDVTVTSTFYYFKASDSYFHTFCRHGGVETYWSSSKDITVTHLKVGYSSFGDLTAYPDCLNQNPVSVITSNYAVNSLVDKWFPTEGTVYNDINDAMSVDRILFYHDYILGHESSMYIQIWYSINGNSKYKEHCQTVFSH